MQHAAISVIIPTWRDDAALARLLAQLAALEPRPKEIVVIDGAEDPATRALVTQAGVHYLSSAPGRGVQLNAGARAATGALLWFVHADAGVPPDATAALRAACEQGADGGYFRFRFDGEPRAFKRLLEACIAVRCRFGMVYGDQALFVTRAAWNRAGGFADEPLFEEVPLVRALKAGRRFVALPQSVTVSARRWERDGYLWRTLQNRLLALGAALGVPPRRLASWYRRR
jgi:rSAM/selenodomain-associated transferase 2